MSDENGLKIVTIPSADTSDAKERLAKLLAKAETGTVRTFIAVYVENGQVGFSMSEFEQMPLKLLGALELVKRILLGHCYVE